MNKAPFDKGEVEVLLRWQYLGRVSYFVLVSLLIVPGTIIAISYLLMSPQDALYVVPIALVATSFGSNTAYHMYFTHRTFTTGRLFHAVLAFLGTILCQDSIAQWVANHKRHHRHTDVVNKDPHTPWQFGESKWLAMAIGLLWASAGWKFSRIKSVTVFYARQITDDPIAPWFDRHFVTISLAVLILPGIAGWLVDGRELALKWFCYFGAFRVFIGYFFTECVVNGLCHALGSRKFHVKGKSTNLVLTWPRSRLAQRYSTIIIPSRAYCRQPLVEKLTQCKCFTGYLKN